MKFEDIIEEWKSDREWDPTDVSEEYKRLPGLHQKYLDYLILYKSKVKRLEQNLRRAERDRTEYYRGRGEEPFPYRLVSQEIDSYVKADETYQEIESKLENAKICQFYLEKIVRMLESRNYDLKSSVEWAKFIGGR